MADTQFEEYDEVVISGVGGFFPKCSNMEEFKKYLLNNEELLGSRWKPGERGVTNRIGVLPSIEHFDTAYFGIHRQQATFMDPMQRLILERTFEALIDAGVNPSDIKGKRVGVYMGSTVGENDNLFYESIVSGFGVTGHSRAMLPNRVSYWLNLKGPSCAYDSNWINGIEVLRLAFEAIREGHIESAIVGTANLALNSELSWLYNDMGLLSADGTTRSFDAEASGYARSDGIVVLYLQRACDAKRVYATVVNAATMFNGYREGTLLDLDLPSMVDFMNDFYKKAEVDPSVVPFVEAYGSGQKHIDKVEVEALAEVYCKNRKNGPLLIGSVKPNTGHSEASSALFSIVKALIALDSGVIPANIQYSNPNPEIKPLVDGTVAVVTENTPFEPEYVAVNGIGLDSYYGHVLLKANPKKKQLEKDDLPRLVVASTRTETGIKELLETVKAKPTLDPEYIGLIHDVYARPIPGHLYRGYTILDGEGQQETEYHQGSKRQLWFVFSGMGSQWVGMARDLMQLPIFARAIHKCHEILKPRGVDLLKIVTDTSDANMFENILHSFVGIAAVQIGLTDILKAVGLVPDGIIGHSVGELGCAYADGCMTVEQMILSAYSRGKASLEAGLIKGMMAAVGMGYQQLKDKVPPTIEVACHNGPDSATISGPTEDMEVFVKQLQDEGIFARLVNVSNIAYHSRYIKPAAPLLLDYLKQVLPESVPRSSKWVSTSVPEAKWDSDLAKSSSPDYHTNNLLSSVLFEEGLTHIPKDSILIEIAPHGLLQAILKRSLKPGCTNIPLTQRGNKNGLTFLLSALGKLYLTGLDLNIANLYSPIEYPVSRGTYGLADLVHWEHGETWRTGLEDKLNYLVSVKDIQVTLNSEEFRDCVGHSIDERIILPVSSYLLVIIKILSTSTAKEVSNVVFENLRFKKIIAIPRIGSVPLYAMIQKGSGEFEIVSGDDIVVTGKVSVPAQGEKFFVNSDVELPQERIKLTGEDVYSEFSHRGYKYSGLFKTVKSLSLTEEGSISTVQWKNTWQFLLEAMIQQVLFPEGEKQQNILVPSSIQRIALALPSLPAEESQDLEVVYDYYTGIISTEGLQISSLSAKPLPLDKRPVSFNSIEFVPLINAVNKKTESLVNVALHLVLDNFEDKLINSVTITEVESGDKPTLTENIKNVVGFYPQLNLNISSVKDFRSVLITQNDPLLIVLNDYITEEAAKTVIGSNAFLLLKSDKNILSYPGLVEVAQHRIGAELYSILRKSNDVEPLYVKVDRDSLSINDLSSASWATELKSKLSKLKTPDQNVFLVASSVPTDGVYNFSRSLTSLPEFSKARTLFVLDKNAPRFDASNSYYKNIFKRNLTLTVLIDGAVGTYIPVPISCKDSVATNVQTISNVIEQKSINYIGVNVLDETLLPKEDVSVELGNIDYSGVTNSGQPIMGLSRLDLESYKLIPDPILTWPVPEDWSLEDAATVPHAFCGAYRALIQKGRLQPGETVLIHAGCSPIGLAAISVASIMGCAVYTTVATDFQRAYLKKQFVFLSDRNIFTSENASFEAHFLMATGGVGAHVVLNCVSGSLLQASVRCVAAFGRFIQLGKFDLDENNSIGMSVFLKNTSFYGLVLENIFDADLDEKQELRGLIEEGIKKLTVRPLQRKVVEHQNVEDILRNLKSKENVGKVIIKLSNNIAINKYNVNRTSQFICDLSSAYLIYGGDSEMWTDMAEWLILRGARKIVISSDHKSQQTSINRRLSLLQKYFNAKIVVAPCKARNREGALELLSEVYSLGPIHAIFILPPKADEAKAADIKPVQFLDQALRTTAPKAIFVNFVQSATGVGQLRNEAGFTTYNIQWDSNLGFSDALYGLDEILSLKINNILVKNDKIADTEQESSQALFKKLQLLLPASAKDLIKQAKYAEAEPELIQLPTLGPRVMRELPPLFIIPGLMGEGVLRDFADQLLYPTFYAALPFNPLSFQDIAVDLAEKMRKLYPRGPYNIVGISSGGALAIEVARLLERKGANTLVYFIDGAPETIQAALKHLGEGTAAEVNLLSRVLNVNNSDVLKSWSALPSWNARVNAAVASAEGIQDDGALLATALTTIKQRLTDVNNYRATEELIKCPVFLIRPTGSSKYDNCGLLKYCKQTANIHIVPGDHLSIIKNKGTADIVNEHVTVS